jgi:hypothetical protein
MPHVDISERLKCKREYKAPAPGINIVARKSKQIVHQYNFYPPPITLAPVNILTLAEIEAKYGTVK